MKIPLFAMAVKQAPALAPQLLALKCPHVLPGEKEEDLMELLTTPSNQRLDILSCIVEHISSYCKKLRSTSNEDGAEIEEERSLQPIFKMSKLLGENSRAPGLIQDLSNLGIADASAFVSATSSCEAQQKIWIMLLKLAYAASHDALQGEDAFQLASDWSQKPLAQANYDASSIKLIPRDIEKEVKSKFRGIDPNEKNLLEAIKGLKEESKALGNDASGKDDSVGAPESVAGDVAQLLEQACDFNSVYDDTLRRWVSAHVGLAAPPPLGPEVALGQRAALELRLSAEYSGNIHRSAVHITQLGRQIESTPHTFKQHISSEDVVEARANKQAL